MASVCRLCGLGDSISCSTWTRFSISCPVGGGDGVAATPRAGRGSPRRVLLLRHAVAVTADPTSMGAQVWGFRTRSIFPLQLKIMIRKDFFFFLP